MGLFVSISPSAPATGATALPSSNEQPGFGELCADPIEIVFPLCRHANQTHSDLPEEAIEEGITYAALRALMGGVIKFDGRHDPRRFGAVENEIDVLLTDAIGVTSPPVAIVTGDDIGKANLA